MVDAINTLSEELLYGSPEAPEIAGLEEALVGGRDTGTDDPESGHDRHES